MSKKEIIKVDPNALTNFSKALALSNKMLDAAEHRPAEWFDTPEKRLEWWLDLEPQWKQAFMEAVLFRKTQSGDKYFVPKDSELAHLFELKTIMVCGTGAFESRNNRPDISFQLTNLTGLKNLTRLTRLEFDFNGGIQSLDPIRHLKNLETLWADNNDISDLSPLVELPNLTALSIWNNNIKSLEPIAGMFQLQDLTVGLYEEGNPLESLEPLKDLFNLRSLYAASCGITSLEPLRNCKKLRSLIVDYNDIESLDPINDLSIAYLSAAGNPRLSG